MPDAPAKKRRGPNKSSNKENAPPPPGPENDDVTTPTPAAKPASRKKKVGDIVVVKDDPIETLNWSKAEKGKLFDWFLDTNEDDHEKRFTLLVNNRSEAYRQVSTPPHLRIDFC